MQIYHNPRCAKSRAGLAYLESKTSVFEIIKYLDNGLTVNELKMIVQKTGKKPFELIRTQEELYKKKFKGKSLNENEWLAVIAENPRLLQRPIVIKGDKAILAQPPEEIDTIL